MFRQFQVITVCLLSETLAFHAGISSFLTSSNRRTFTSPIKRFGSPAFQRSPRIVKVSMGIFSEDFAPPSKADLIQDFLTQRSVQTLLHSMRLVGDMTSLNYLESFMDHQGLSNYHGYGGLKTDSANYVMSLQREVPFVVIEKKQVHRGGSPNNPYVIANVVSYTSTVHPRSIASKIVSMREIIAKECIEDLNLIQSENVELLRHHQELVRHHEDKAESLVPPLHEDSDEHSALRVPTYDLLEKMSTDVAVQNIINMLQGGPLADRLAGKWLHEQYMGNHGGGFRGDHGAEVGRKFMRHLLSSVPILISSSKSGRSSGASMAIVDPHDVAHRIMREREQLAARWSERLSETSLLHCRWNAKLLEACFKRPSSQRQSDLKSRSRPSGRPRLTDGAGV